MHLTPIEQALDASRRKEIVAPICFAVGPSVESTLWSALRAVALFEPIRTTLWMPLDSATRKEVSVHRGPA